MSKNCVVSIKTATDTREDWKAHALEQGMSFNAWAIRTLNEQVELDGALDKDNQSKRRQRKQVLQTSFPQGSCSKDGGYCYVHDTRHV